MTIKLAQWLFPERAARLAAAEHALNEPDNPMNVGPLADALRLGNRQMRRRVEHGLIRILPRLRAEDADQLNFYQRQALYRALSNRNTSIELKLAILKALETVGDEMAVLPVQQLTVSESVTAAHPQVIQAAKACLPFLMVRAEQLRKQQLTETLLRASDRPGVPLETLRQPEQSNQSTPVK